MQIFNEDFYLKKTILVILALILSTQSSFAIEDIKKVDIKQAIEIARENNLDILSSRMNVDIAKICFIILDVQAREIRSKSAQQSL